jgi:hypothetical protein
MRIDMSFEFLKAENQFLETDIPSTPLNVFRNQFLKDIVRNQFFL